MRIAEGDMFACHLLLLQMICLQLVYRGVFYCPLQGFCLTLLLLHFVPWLEAVSEFMGPIHYY